LGYALFKTRGKRLRLPIPFVVFMWLGSFAVMGAVLIGIQDWFDPTVEIPDVPRFFFAAFNRMAWSCSISWIIFACVKVRRRSIQKDNVKSSW
jgi:hypothetical protein